MLMESSYNAAALDSHDTTSRPTIGFPLGTALLLLVIFSLSGVFSCCYHWDKLRRCLSTRAADVEANGNLRHSKTIEPNMLLNLKRHNQGPQVILMPGDNVPKFIAHATLGKSQLRCKSRRRSLCFNPWLPMPIYVAETNE